jgi:hypothetical protein
MPRRMPTAAIYAALNSLSEGFEQALSAMDLLNKMGVAKSDLFEGCRILTQEAAAWARYQIVQTLGDHELENWTKCGRRWQQWQKRNEDPETGKLRGNNRPTRSGSEAQKSIKGSGVCAVSFPESARDRRASHAD